MPRLFIAVCLLLGLAACNTAPQNPPKDKNRKLPGITVVGHSELDSLSAAIAAAPRPDALNRRAQIYSERGQYREALADMKSALTMDTTKAPYFVTLGNLYLALAGAPAAEDAYKKALRLDSTNANALLGMGRVQYIKQKFPEAMRYLNASLRRDVNNPDVYFWKGMLYKGMGKAALAKSSFTTATEQDPAYAEAYLQLGLAAEAAGDSLALRYYNNAIRADTSMPDARYARGLWHQNHKQPTLAVLDYRAAARADTTNPDPLFNAGILALEAKQYTLAADDFAATLLRNDHFAKGWYFRGQALQKAGKTPDARKAYQEALKLDPAYSQAARALASLR